MMSFDTPYMWNLKEWYTGTHLQSRNGLTDVEANLWLPGGKGRDKWGVWG